MRGALRAFAFLCLPSAALLPLVHLRCVEAALCRLGDAGQLQVPGIKSAHTRSHTYNLLNTTPGEYLGGAFTCDAHHMTEPLPDGGGEGDTGA